MGYSHLDSAKVLEPFDGYAELRARCPLHAEEDHEPPFYVLTRFADVLDVLKQPGLWGNGDGPGVFYQEAGVLGSADDPDHARHRRVLRAAFLPTAIARLEPRLAAVVDALLDDLVPRRGGDLVEDFAFPFPALVIGELLGVHPDDAEEFRDWSLKAVTGLTGGDLVAYEEAKNAIADRVEAEVERRLGLPADELPDDVCSLMAVAERDGILSRQEVRHLGYQLLVAGHETTTSLIGLMMYRLLQHPDVMAQLRADPELIPQAIEEALRFDSPVQGLFRTNAAECAVAGSTLPAGTKVQLLFASANRDEDRFDHPADFRLDRSVNELRRHVAFGWGIHLCIGAPLARLETRLAFERILARMDDIELAGEPARNESFILRGLTSLPLRWTPRET
jgi:cytochrome P450